MDSTTIIRDLPSVAQGGVFDLGGLYCELEKLSDKRKARGKRYSLALIIVLAVLAKLCGEDRPYGMAQWVSAREQGLTIALGVARRRLPCLNTFRRVLQTAVNLKQLQKALNRFVLYRVTLEHSALIAMDGKCMRHSLTPGQDQPVHLLAAYVPAEGVVLWQVALASTENEITAAPRLLRCVDLRGKVVIGDAMFTQRELSTQIVQAGGEYIWLAKENQPRLQEAIAQLFAPQPRTPGWGTPPHDFQTAVTHNKGHGRVEARSLTSSELLNDYLDWPHVSQVFKLERRRTKLKKEDRQTEVVYGLTSLSRQQADAARLLALARDYWGIENGLHYCRDVTLHEDGTRITHPALAEAMAMLNNLVIALIRQMGWPCLPQARRHYDAHPAEALALLLRPPG
jgi:predicted transposase YbfD/YdcC